MAMTFPTERWTEGMQDSFNLHKACQAVEIGYTVPHMRYYFACNGLHFQKCSPFLRTVRTKRTLKTKHFFWIANCANRANSQNKTFFFDEMEKNRHFPKKVCFLWFARFAEFATAEEVCNYEPRYCR